MGVGVAGVNAVEYKDVDFYNRGREGETALHLAASCGCHELVLLLLKQGTSVDPEVKGRGRD